MLFVLFCGINCKKDAPIKKITKEISKNKNGFVALNWNAAEQDFFSTEPRNLGQVQSRNEKSLRYNPIVVSVYNEIAKQNQTHHFVDSIVCNVGVPLWAESFTYIQKGTKENLLLIPFYRRDKQEISGFISATRLLNEPNQPLILNSISRPEILNTESGDPRQKSVYGMWMLEYDYLLFKRKDETLKSAVKNYDDKIKNPLFGPPPPPVCSWTLVNLCWNSETQNTFVGASPDDLSPYGDYNHDGIINKNDQEWVEMVYNEGDHDKDGVPNSLDPDYWCWFRDVGDHDHDGIGNDIDPDWQLLEEISGGQIEWDDIWDDYFGEIEQLDADQDGIPDEVQGGWVEHTFHFWEHVGDALGNMFGNFGEWVGGEWDDFDRWLDGLFDDVHCPFPNLSGEAMERTVCCSWFYIYNCSNTPLPPNWWEHLSSLPGYVAFEDADQYKDYALSQMIQKYGLDCTSAELGCLAEDCDAFAPDFEDCVGETVTQTFLPAAASGLFPVNFQKDFNCFDSQNECPNCNYTAVLYIEQPKPGTRDLYNLEMACSGLSGKKANGHTFLSLNQFDKSFSKDFPKNNIILGFYPANHPTGNEDTPGAFYLENSDTKYNISVTFEITRLQFDAIVNFYASAGVPANYNVGYSNCSTWPVAALEKIGITLPKTARNQWPVGQIDVNPADLGEDLRLNCTPGVLTESYNFIYLTSPTKICN